MPEREVFPNAPLEFVAAEIRFPYSPKLGRHESFDALIEALSDYFPVPQRADKQQLAVGPQGVKAADPQVVWRLLARDKMSSLTVGQSRMALEVTDYQEYPDFRDLLSHALEALDDLGVIVGVERAGLRFIDEVRAPSVESIEDWRGYIADELLAALVFSDWGGVEALEGTVRLATGDDMRLVFRYASLVGDGVVGGGPLRRRSSPPTGPFFVLDTDSYWESEELLDFNKEEVLATFDGLHDPVGVVFHQAITERLKDEVLRRKS